MLYIKIGSPRSSGGLDFSKTSSKVSNIFLLQRRNHPVIADPSPEQAPVRAPSEEQPCTNARWSQTARPRYFRLTVAKSLLHSSGLQALSAPPHTRTPSSVISPSHLPLCDIQIGH